MDTDGDRGLSSRPGAPPSPPRSARRRPRRGRHRPSLYGRTTIPGDQTGPRPRRPVPTPPESRRRPEWESRRDGHGRPERVGPGPRREAGRPGLRHRDAGLRVAPGQAEVAREDEGERVLGRPKVTGGRRRRPPEVVPGSPAEGWAGRPGTGADVSGPRGVSAPLLRDPDPLPPTDRRRWDHGTREEQGRGDPGGWERGDTEVHRCRSRGGGGVTGTYE